MKYTIDTLEYKTKEKRHNNITVIEYKPIYTPKEQEERNQYVTQRCVELLKKYNRI